MDTSLQSHRLLVSAQIGQSVSYGCGLGFRQNNRDRAFRFFITCLLTCLSCNLPTTLPGFFRGSVLMYRRNDKACVCHKDKADTVPPAVKCADCHFVTFTTSFWLQLSLYNYHLNRACVKYCPHDLFFQYMERSTSTNFSYLLDLDVLC